MAEILRKKILNYTFTTNPVLKLSNDFWTVYEAEDDSSDLSDSKEIFFMKCIKINVLTEFYSLKSFIENDLNMLEILNHSLITKLRDKILTKNHAYIVTEHLEISLANLISDKRVTDAYKIISQIIKVFQYLNEEQIIHVNLKPESIFFKNGKLKLTNFGFATSYGVPKCKSIEFSLFGSIDYASYEVLQGKEFTEKADVWSLGIIIFELLTGYHPFCQKSGALSREELSAKYVSEDIKYPYNISQNVILLLMRMLQPLEINRIKWNEVFASFRGLERTDFEIPEIALYKHLLYYYMLRRENAFLYNRLIYKTSHLFSINKLPLFPITYVQCILALLQSFIQELKSIKNELSSKSPPIKEISIYWPKFTKSFEFDKLKDELRIDSKKLENCKIDLLNKLNTNPKTQTKKFEFYKSSNQIDEIFLKNQLIATFEEIKQAWEPSGLDLPNEGAYFLWELKLACEFKENFYVSFSIEKMNFPDFEKHIEEFRKAKPTFLGTLYRK